MKRYLLRIIPLVLVGILFAAATFVGGSIAQIMFNMSGSANAQALLQNPFHQGASEPEVSDTLPDDFYMLLLGVDSNANRKDGTEAELYGGAFRSDSIIVAHISLSDQKISLCSLERDIKIVLDGYESDGYNKLNAAYALGGIDLMRKEAEELVDETIPYYAVVDMDGLADMIDSVGGVEVDVEKAFFDEMLNDGIETAGLQTLDGYTAVMYSRSRYAWDEGDFARARHQRDVLKALANKTLKDSNLMSLYNMAQTVSQNVATNITLGQIYEIAAKMRGMNADNDIYSLMTPTISDYDNGISYQILDDELWNETLKHFRMFTSPKAVSDEEIARFESSQSNKNDLSAAEDLIRQGRHGQVGVSSR